VLSSVVLVPACPRENCLPPGPIDPPLPQSHSLRALPIPFPYVPTSRRSDVRTALYLLRNHIVAKSDELTHIESHRCTKPRGEGVPSRTSGERTGSLATRHSPLSPVESTPPRNHESVSKQTALTSLESALTRLPQPHRKQTTSSLPESTLMQFVNITPLESALPKKGGGGGVEQTFLSALLRPPTYPPGYATNGPAKSKLRLLLCALWFTAFRAGRPICPRPGHRGCLSRPHLRRTLDGILTS
jgi:hypothetical protein